MTSCGERSDKSDQNSKEKNADNTFFYWVVSLLSCKLKKTIITTEENAAASLFKVKSID